MKLELLLTQEMPCPGCSKIMRIQPLMANGDAYTPEMIEHAHNCAGCQQTLQNAFDNHMFVAVCDNCQGVLTIDNDKWIAVTNYWMRENLKTEEERTKFLQHVQKLGQAFVSHLRQKGMPLPTDVIGAPYFDKPQARKTFSDN